MRTLHVDRFAVMDFHDAGVIGVGGVGSGRDALEYIMAGASAVQIGTSILARGLGVFDQVVKEMASLLEEGGFRSVSEAIGVAHA